jgi:hypothetical protein
VLPLTMRNGFPGSAVSLTPLPTTTGRSTAPSVFQVPPVGFRETDMRKIFFKN